MDTSGDTTAGHGDWAPLTPAELVDVLRPASCPWWLAGGWAIDLHVGALTREHEDIDVLVLRPDQQAIRRPLQDWDLHAADPPGSLRPWVRGETLPPEVHDVWCRPSSDEPWRLQLMLDEVVDGRWTYRRDARISRPVDELSGPASTETMRVLAPEVQLLYKSKDPRPKDHADWAAARGTLGEPASAWLADALALVSPAHPWLDDL